MSIKKFLALLSVLLLFASPLVAETYVNGVLQGGSGLSSSCADNQIMKWDAALGAWACEADSEGAGGADAAAYHDNVASEITATTAITALADLDEFVLEDQSDSNNKKAITAANIAVYMKSEVQDTFYTETEADAAFQPTDADLTAIAALACTENQLISRTAGGSWECADAAAGSGDVAKTGTINADEITVWSDATTIKALTEAEFKTAYNMEAGTDYQGVLSDEAGLYSALSDVSDFFQPTDDLTGTDGQLIDLSGITQTADTNEGLILPTWADVSASGVSRGAIAWSEASDTLKILSDAGWQSISPTGAPVDAAYITGAANATLTNEVNVGAYTAGLVGVVAGTVTDIDTEAELYSVLSDVTDFVQPSDNVTLGTISATAITGTSFVIGSADIGETELEILDGATVTTTQLNYLDATSSVQTQMNLKSPLASPTFTGTVTLPAVTLGGDIAVGANELQSTANIVFQLGDAAGANVFEIEDSAGVTVWSVNSDGGMTAIASTDPYIALDQSSATDVYLGSYDTTLDLFEIRTSATVATGPVATWVIGTDATKGDMENYGSINIPAAHVYKIAGTQIDIGDLGAAGDWTPTGTINLDSSTLVVDADLLNIDYAETNYTPATTGVGVDVNDLAAHLEGIDNALGATAAGTLQALTDTVGVTGANDFNYAAGNLIIGDGADSFDEKAVTGDVTISSAGVTTIGATKVDEGMMNDASVDLASATVTGVLPDANVADDITITAGSQIASGSPTFTAVTSSTVNVDLLDAVGAVDMDYGSDNITDHTFISDNGVAVVDGDLRLQTAAGSDRWAFIRSGAEEGANAGSDLILQPYDDSGVLFDEAAFAVDRASGATIIYGTNSALNVVGQDVDGEFLILVDDEHDAVLGFGVGAEERWRVGKSSTQEIGSEVGSDFFIQRYDDDGAYIATDLTIQRSTGNVQVYSDLIVDDGDITGSFDMVTTGSIRGAIARVDVDSTDADDSYTLSTAEGYGTFITNYGDDDALTIVLPDVVDGMSVCVANYAAFNININPNGTERILVDTDANGDSLDSDDTLGSFYCLIGISATEWMPMGNRGTWTDAN